MDEILTLLKYVNAPMVKREESVMPKQELLKPEPTKAATKSPIVRTKRSYYPITETMWGGGDLKAKFIEFPHEMKSKVFSDGESYYVETQYKKNLLNNNLLLKLLNNKYFLKLLKKILVLTLKIITQI